MTTHLDFLNKLKRLTNPLQPLLIILTSIFFLALCSFLFSNYTSPFLNSTTFNPNHNHQQQIGNIPWRGGPGSSMKGFDLEEVRLGFLEESENVCDVFDGVWIWDENYPLYQTKDCVFIDVGFRCSENGRLDSLYSKWRWQPKNCNLPRFDSLF